MSILNLFRKWFAPDVYVAELEEQVRAYNEEVEELAKVANQHVTYITEQVAQIRCYQTKSQGEKGWMVGLFIADSAVQELRDKGMNCVTGAFLSQLTESMLRQAIKKIYHIDDNGKLAALVFEPFRTDDLPVAPLKCVFHVYDKDGTIKVAPPEKAWYL